MSLFQLKDLFWNEMLIMFYLKVFYLPYLKKRTTKIEQNNEISMCYAQIACYHVYVPLLLRLSNDVEENPGPRSIDEVVDPSTHIAPHTQPTANHMYAMRTYFCEFGL